MRGGREKGRKGGGRRKGEEKRRCGLCGVLYLWIHFLQRLLLMEVDMKEHLLGEGEEVSSQHSMVSTQLCLQ